MTTINSHKYVYSKNVNISCPTFAGLLCVVRPLPLQYSAPHRLFCSCGPRLKTSEIHALYKTDSRCVWRPNHMANLVPCMQHEMLLGFHAQPLFCTAFCNCDHGQQHNKKQCVVVVYVLRQKIKYWIHFPRENRFVYAKQKTEYAWCWGWFSSQRNFICL